MTASAASLSSRQVENLVSAAKKNRKNRVYYDKYFQIVDLRRAGLVQDEQKTKQEYVQMDANQNEFIHLLGLDVAGSYFSLKISIASLYPDSQKTRQESDWRNAAVELTYWNQAKKTKYRYSHEQLIDYADKRADPQKHEHKSIHKIGSLSLEIVSPYTFARVLFNGLMLESTTTGEAGQTSEKLVPVKLTLSTHPTCDKFDYKYRFTKKHLRRMLTDNAAATNALQPKKLLNLLLEDRIDQPVMLQGHLERIDEEGDAQQGDKFILWGAKVKKFLKPTEQLNEDELLKDIPREHLFVWVESGQQVHLSRPIGHPALVYGMVHNSFDYASPIGDVKLSVADAEQHQREAPLEQLESFDRLSSAKYTISFKSFKIKDYTLQFHKPDESNLLPSGLLRVSVNECEGWALSATEELCEFLERSQKERLLVLNIHNSLTSFKLASERLLGGKGNSLVDLARLTTHRQLSAVSPRAVEQSVDSTGGISSLVKVSVPRGVVVSCVAYKYWLASNPSILRAINELDCVRRVLSAKSIYLNPLSKDYMPIGQSKQILEEQCRKTGLTLRSCPLPDLLAKKLTSELIEIFGPDNLKDETTDDGAEKPSGSLKFAVRSSAMGEDSLETSAAGQMKTILGARGLNSIFSSIIECWSSQFELEAVTYKTQNGLAFNLPMAVVVQELIDCYAAGVAATCNPVNGDLRQLEITANLGLGEGVVSGKQTDTIRVRLVDEHEYLTEKLGATCCLEDANIISLANLLVKLRRASSIEEREIEWGITKLGNDSKENEQSSSSSSSSSSASGRASPATFQIHLLQSRPLTNLTRLSANETDHELDYGFGSPIDVVSRANLGEVMPGALCAMNLSYFQPITTSYATHKPFEKMHTRKTFAADAFGFYSNMAVMVYTYSDTIKRFAGQRPSDLALSKAALYTMLGSTFEYQEDEQYAKKLLLLQREKVNPLASDTRRGLTEMLILDTGLLQRIIAKSKRDVNSIKFHDDLMSLERLMVAIERPGNGAIGLIKQQISLVFTRLTSVTGALSKGWMCHINATILSMLFNVMCLKLFSDQPAYPDDVTSSEILNDFSVLMRSSARDDRLGKQTESGDTSKLLTRLVESLVEEGQLERVKSFSHKELYNYLAEGDSKSRSSRLYRDFIERNGHRAYKEFCLSTKTWSDDSSYIVKSLSMRLKQYSKEATERERKRAAAVERDHEARLAAVESKITNKRFVLLKYAIPRARNATIRREETKSLMIKAVHKHRLALRHLGGLLCLAGCLPSADIIFHLTIDELNSIVSDLLADRINIDLTINCQLPERTSDLSRYIYKARRRQQRMKAFDQVNFPRPNLRFFEMIETLSEQVDGKPSTSASNVNGATPSIEQTDLPKTSQLVRGLTSCGGCVTGRACVVSSIEEMDQLIEPGDILITYSIDISWSVYFFALSGIVTEVGGIVSHGAVVAREYGIPTLCTALEACSKFKTGQMITLDADKGICYLAESKDQQQGETEKQL